ncbi:MAG: DJ-1/PfpI family protein [bacterium]|jgi:protease I
MKPILMIIAPDHFRDEELFETKAAIEAAGLKTVVASTHEGECEGTKGGKAIAEIEISKVKSKDYQSVVFVGGNGSRVYFHNETAHSIAKEMYEDGKVVSAICIGPAILAEAGLLKNKKATVYESEINTIKDLGATYTGESVTQDGQLITGNGPAASSLFGKTIAEEVKKRVDLVTF